MLSKQTENCLRLFSGQAPEKIMAGISFLKSTVVEELMDFTGAKSKSELAEILSNYN